MKVPEFRFGHLVVAGAFVTAGCLWWGWLFLAAVPFLLIAVAWVARSVKPRPPLRPPLLRDKETGACMPPIAAMDQARAALPAEHHEWFDWTARMAGFNMKPTRDWYEETSAMLDDIERRVNVALLNAEQPPPTAERG